MTFYSIDLHQNFGFFLKKKCLESFEEAFPLKLVNVKKICYQRLQFLKYGTHER